MVIPCGMKHVGILNVIL